MEICGEADSVIALKAPADGQVGRFEAVKCSSCDFIVPFVAPYAAFENLSGCRILVVADIVIIRSCSNCVFTVAATTVRVSQSENVILSLHTQNASVIENSTAIHFAPWTAQFPKMGELLADASLAAVKSRWADVRDCNAEVGRRAFAGNFTVASPADSWSNQTRLSPIAKLCISALLNHFDADCDGAWSYVELNAFQRATGDSERIESPEALEQLMASNGIALDRNGCLRYPALVRLYEMQGPAALERDIEAAGLTSELGPGVIPRWVISQLFLDVAAQRWLERQTSGGARAGPDAVNASNDDGGAKTSALNIDPRKLPASRPMEAANDSGNDEHEDDHQYSADFDADAPADHHAAPVSSGGSPRPPSAAAAAVAPSVHVPPAPATVVDSAATVAALSPPVASSKQAWAATFNMSTHDDELDSALIDKVRMAASRAAIAAQLAEQHSIDADEASGGGGGASSRLGLTAPRPCDKIPSLLVWILQEVMRQSAAGTAPQSLDDNARHPGMSAVERLLGSFDASASDAHQSSSGAVHTTDSGGSGVILAGDLCSAMLQLIVQHDLRSALPGALISLTVADAADVIHEQLESAFGSVHDHRYDDDSDAPLQTSLMAACAMACAAIGVSFSPAGGRLGVNYGFLLVQACQVNLWRRCGIACPEGFPTVVSARKQQPTDVDRRRSDEQLARSRAPGPAAASTVPTSPQPASARPTPSPRTPSSTSASPGRSGAGSVRHARMYQDPAVRSSSPSSPGGQHQSPRASSRPRSPLFTKASPVPASPAAVVVPVLSTDDEQRLVSAAQTALDASRADAGHVIHGTIVPPLRSSTAASTGRDTSRRGSRMSVADLRSAPSSRSSSQFQQGSAEHPWTPLATAGDAHGVVSLLKDEIASAIVKVSYAYGSIRKAIKSAATCTIAPVAGHAIDTSGRYLTAVTVAGIVDATLNIAAPTPIVALMLLQIGGKVVLGKGGATGDHEDGSRVVISVSELESRIREMKQPAGLASGIQSSRPAIAASASASSARETPAERRTKLFKTALASASIGVPRLNFVPAGGWLTDSEIAAMLLEFDILPDVWARCEASAQADAWLESKAGRSALHAEEAHIVRERAESGTPAAALIMETGSVATGVVVPEVSALARDRILEQKVAEILKDMVSNPTIARDLFWGYVKDVRNGKWPTEAAQATVEAEQQEALAAESEAAADGQQPLAFPTSHGCDLYRDGFEAWLQWREACRRASARKVAIWAREKALQAAASRESASEVAPLAQVEALVHDLASRSVHMVVPGTAAGHDQVLQSSSARSRSGSVSGASVRRGSIAHASPYDGGGASTAWEGVAPSSSAVHMHGTGILPGAHAHVGPVPSVCRSSRDGLEIDARLARLRAAAEHFPVAGNDTTMALSHLQSHSVPGIASSRRGSTVSIGGGSVSARSMGAASASVVDLASRRPAPGLISRAQFEHEMGPALFSLRADASSAQMAKALFGARTDGRRRVLQLLRADCKDGKEMRDRLEQFELIVRSEIDNGGHSARASPTFGEQHLPDGATDGDGGGGERARAASDAASSLPASASVAGAMSVRSAINDDDIRAVAVQMLIEDESKRMLDRAGLGDGPFTSDANAAITMALAADEVKKIEAEQAYAAWTKAKEREAKDHRDAQIRAAAEKAAQEVKRKHAAQVAYDAWVARSKLQAQDEHRRSSQGIHEHNHDDQGRNGSPHSSHRHPRVDHDRFDDESERSPNRRRGKEWQREERRGTGHVPLSVGMSPPPQPSSREYGRAIAASWARDSPSVRVKRHLKQKPAATPDKASPERGISSSPNGAHRRDGHPGRRGSSSVAELLRRHPSPRAAERHSSKASRGGGRRSSIVPEHAVSVAQHALQLVDMGEDIAGAGTNTAREALERAVDIVSDVASVLARKLAETNQQQASSPRQRSKASASSSTAVRTSPYAASLRNRHASKPNTAGSSPTLRGRQPLRSSNATSPSSESTAHASQVALVNRGPRDQPQQSHHGQRQYELDVDSEQVVVSPRRSGPVIDRLRAALGSKLEQARVAVSRESQAQDDVEEDHHQQDEHGGGDYKSTASVLDEGPAGGSTSQGNSSSAQRRSSELASSSRRSSNQGPTSGFPNTRRQSHIDADIGTAADDDDGNREAGQADGEIESPPVNTGAAAEDNVDDADDGSDDGIDVDAIAPEMLQRVRAALGGQLQTAKSNATGDNNRRMSTNRGTSSSLPRTAPQSTGASRKSSQHSVHAELLPAVAAARADDGVDDDEGDDSDGDDIDVDAIAPEMLQRVRAALGGQLQHAKGAAAGDKVAKKSTNNSSRAVAADHRDTARHAFDETLLLPEELRAAKHILDRQLYTDNVDDLRDDDNDHAELSPGLNDVQRLHQAFESHNTTVDVSIQYSIDDLMVDDADGEQRQLDDQPLESGRSSFRASGSRGGYDEAGKPLWIPSGTVHRRRSSASHVRSPVREKKPPYARDVYLSQHDVGEEEVPAFAAAAASTSAASRSLSRTSQASRKRSPRQDGAAISAKTTKPSRAGGFDLNDDEQLALQQADQRLHHARASAAGTRRSSVAPRSRSGSLAPDLRSSVTVKPRGNNRF